MPSDGDVWENIVGETCDRLPVDDREQQYFCIALILGGSMAARSAVEILLPDGSNPEKGLLSRAAQVCSLALLSVWLDKFDRATPRSDEERGQARREWATVLSDAYADESKRLYEWFLNWDAQYQSFISAVHAKESESNHLAQAGQEASGLPLPFCSTMLADMCIEALGGQAAQVPIAGFPFRGLEDYRNRGGGALTCWDPVAVVSMYASLVDAYESSVKYYKEKTGGAQ